VIGTTNEIVHVTTPSSRPGFQNADDAVNEDIDLPVRAGELSGNIGAPGQMPSTQTLRVQSTSLRERQAALGQVPVCAGKAARGSQYSPERSARGFLERVENFAGPENGFHADGHAAGGLVFERLACSEGAFFAAIFLVIGCRQYKSRRSANLRIMKVVLPRELNCRQYFACITRCGHHHD